MKYLIYVAIFVSWVFPTQAASFDKLVEFNRGPVREVDIAGLNNGLSDLYVVGVITRTGNLKIFVFHGTDPEPRSEFEAGRASSVAVVSGSDNRFFTGMRDGDGKLRVIRWSVDDNGRSLSRDGTVLGPSITAVTGAPGASGERARFAGRLQNGNLFVRDAAIESNGTLSLRDGETYGRVEDMELTGGTFSALVMRIGDGSLRVTTLYTGGTSGVQRGRTGTGGGISGQSIIPIGAGNGEEFVTFTTSAYLSGNLRPSGCIFSTIVVPYGPIGRTKLIAWRQDPVFSQGVLARIGEHDGSGFESLGHDVSMIPFASTGGKWFITAHLGYDKPCSFAPRAEMHLWEFDDGFARLKTTELGGDFDALDMTMLRRGGNSTQSRFVLAVVGRVGDVLKITVYDVDR